MNKPLPEPEPNPVSIDFDSRRGFDSAMAEYGSTVLRYAWRLTRNSDDAEELVQETFLTLWSKRKGLALVGDSLLPWLLVTCRNHGANLARRNHKHDTVPIDDEAAAPPSGAASELEWVLEEIAGMAPLDQAVCRLCLMEGVPYREVGERLNLTTTAVAKRVERARRRLETIRTETGEGEVP